MARRIQDQKDSPSFEAARLLGRGRLSEAFRLFLAAARKGDSRSQLSLGYLYDTGQGVSRSRAQAMAWYRRAARRGEAVAASNIGTIYRGDGRLRLAIRWFGNAVTLGDKAALLDMARLHAGPLQEPAVARRLLSRVLASKWADRDSRTQARRLLRALKGR